jgi:hypothetical protein
MKNLLLGVAFAFRNTFLTETGGETPTLLLLRK